MAILDHQPPINTERFQEITGLDPKHVSEHWTYENGLFRSETILQLTPRELAYITNQCETPQPTQEEIQEAFLNFGRAIDQHYAEIRKAFTQFKAATND